MFKDLFDLLVTGVIALFINFGLPILIILFLYLMFKDIIKISL